MEKSQCLYALKHLRLEKNFTSNQVKRFVSQGCEETIKTLEISLSYYFNNFPVNLSDLEHFCFVVCQCHICDYLCKPRFKTSLANKDLFSLMRLVTKDYTLVRVDKYFWRSRIFFLCHLVFVETSYGSCFLPNVGEENNSLVAFLFLTLDLAYKIEDLEVFAEVALCLYSYRILPRTFMGKYDFDLHQVKFEKQTNYVKYHLAWAMIVYLGLKQENLIELYLGLNTLYCEVCGKRFNHLQSKYTHDKVCKEKKRLKM